MRKEYVKPMAGIELFTLAQSIATYCSGLNKDAGLGEPTHYDENTCCWSLGNTSIFLTDNPTCEEQFDDEDEFFEEYSFIGCYNNPDGGTSVFSS